jgi:hypothetical protein
MGSMLKRAAVRADGGGMDLRSRQDLYCCSRIVHLYYWASHSSRGLQGNITKLSVEEAMEALAGLNLVFFHWRADD